jgi:hypothetical protein
MRFGAFVGVERWRGPALGSGASILGVCSVQVDVQVECFCPKYRFVSMRYGAAVCM